MPFNPIAARSRFDQKVLVLGANIDIRVRVFREPGRLLSRLAHDLELRLESFEFSASGASVELSFEPSALKVCGALTDGVVDVNALDRDKKREIEQNMQREVFETQRFPHSRFSGRFETHAERVAVSGNLKLRDRVLPVEFELVRGAKSHRGTLTIQPSRWGITPYQALFGALKLADRVELTFDVKLAEPELTRAGEPRAPSDA